MANIRNQCSWVHSNEKEAATEKAKDLVRMAVARVGLLEPLYDPEIAMNHSALVIGGGLAGMTAARNLSKQGFCTYLVEKNNVLGGQALNLHATWRGEDVQQNLTRLINDVKSDPNITILTNTQIKNVDGFVGNFQTTLVAAGQEQVIEHGVAIIASGADELKPDQYFYGQDARVMTGLELDKKFVDNALPIKDIKTAVFIQCVGSRIPERPYCSKVCCTQSVKNALQLKKLKPAMDVFIIYRDLRTYGLREGLYREARTQGVVFIRYDFSKELAVSKGKDGLQVRCTSSVLLRELEITADLLVLATPIVSPAENPLAQLFKVPVNDDGFFVEAHVKLQPIDFATQGVFVCGLAHSPKPVDESIAQALGAASRVASILFKDKFIKSAIAAEINPETCVGCMGCLSVCPYNAISFNEKKQICEVNEILCKGCGNCAATCPSQSAVLGGFKPQQLLAQIRAA